MTTFVCIHCRTKSSGQNDYVLIGMGWRGGVERAVCPECQAAARAQNDLVAVDRRRTYPATRARPRPKGEDDGDD